MLKRQRRCLIAPTSDSAIAAVVGRVVSPSVSAPDRIHPEGRARGSVMATETTVAVLRGAAYGRQ